MTLYNMSLSIGLKFDAVLCGKLLSLDAIVKIIDKLLNISNHRYSVLEYNIIDKRRSMIIVKGSLQK